MKLVFAEQAWADCLHWQASDPNTLERVNGLIGDHMRSPFTGLGKPQPLRGDKQGWWSRRITLEDWLVHGVTGRAPDQQLEIAQCRYQY